MLQIIHGKLVKSGRKSVRHEMVIGPSDAPPNMRKYADKVLQALPPIVRDAADREDRVGGLIIALIAELAQLDRADADAIVQTLPVAYEELISWYQTNSLRSTVLQVPHSRPAV